jgi:hypothetical protein
VVVGGIVAGLALAAWTGKRRLVALGPLLLTALGALLLFAAIVSRLPELQVNELLAVFLPVDFLLLSSRPLVAARYTRFRLAGLALVALLAGLGVLIQPLWPFWALALGIVVTTAVGARGRQRRPRAA